MKHAGVISLALLLMSLAAPSMAATWQVPGDFATIQEAIDSSLVIDGDKIMVSPGQHAGAIVTKAVEIRGEGGAVINSGPLPWSSRTFMAGFLFPGNGAGSGARITQLHFETVEFPVFSRGADNVSVDHCEMANPIQGVSNWRGCFWEISHNEILDLRTACGGGIGILIGDYMATQGGIMDNVVSHNTILGTLNVDPNDCGGYAGSGAVLYADFRWGMPGAELIAFNRVSHNRVSLTSSNPDLVPVVALELTDTQDPVSAETTVIRDNAVVFNNLRGTDTQIALTPSDLDEVNNVSRNLGDNRGHGHHPLAFRPEGN
jgi:hypothetical protein